MSMRILTKDGSYTLSHDVFDASYHSTHGALTESMTVFIQNGLHHMMSTTLNSIRILEIGFGTGLNFVLTLDACLNKDLKLTYTGIEKYPMTWDQVLQFEYLDLLAKPDQIKSIYQSAIKAHSYSGQCGSSILDFELNSCDFKTYAYPEEAYDLIYYDAFGPGIQPELWNQDMADKMAKALRADACLVTYCVQGQWRRHLIASGFSCEKLPGPPGKREVLRATKIG